jgi:hypothetical protein
VKAQGNFWFDGVIASVFFFVRWFVGRFGRAVGQTHSLPSFGLRVAWCDLAMCVAVERWHFYSFNVFANVVLNSFSLL